MGQTVSGSYWIGHPDGNVPHAVRDVSVEYTIETYTLESPELLKLFLINNNCKTNSLKNQKENYYAIIK